MNAHNTAKVRELIESAHNPHEACGEMWEQACRTALYWMGSSGHYQRQATLHQRRSRIWAAVAVGLSGLVLALAVSR